MAIRHEGTERQGRWLRQVLRGWMAYYAVPMSGSAGNLSIPASRDRTLARRGWLSYFFQGIGAGFGAILRTCSGFHVAF